MGPIMLLWLSVAASLSAVSGCGPGRGPLRRRGPRKILPLIFKQHEPNFSERSLAASGIPDGAITRDDKEFRRLVPNYNPDIIFKDEEGTGADRIMTKRCKEKLNTLAISVMNQWPGLRVRVTEAWDEENHHARNSLHYEGRAVDITTSDRDRSKYGLLASLAVEAGFDWVYYESRSHVHASCKAESAHPGKDAGCFPPDALVTLDSGVQVPMADIRLGDRVLAQAANGDAVYSEVLLFLDRSRAEVRTYVTITTESGAALTLTEAHLVEVVEAGGATFAGNVEPGHHLLVALNDAGSGERILAPERVISVAVSRRRGVYAPLTYTGNLVVDGVLASSYAVIDRQWIAHAAFAPVRWWFDLKHLWQRALQSLFNSSTRSSGTSSSESSDSRNNISESSSTIDTSADSSSRTDNGVEPSEGVHWYASLLYSIAGYILPGHLVRLADR